MKRPFLACVALAAAFLAPQGALAGGTIEVGEDHSVTFGAGLRSAFTSIEDSNDFSVQSVRLYVNGQIHEKVKFTFNTECIGCVFGEQDPDRRRRRDRCPRRHRPVRTQPGVQHLARADADAGGPHRAQRAVLRPVVEPIHGAAVAVRPARQCAGLLGRDDGVTVWGTLGKVQYAAGLFDGVNGGPNTEDDSALFAGRVAINFLAMEANPAYLHEQHLLRRRR